MKKHRATLEYLVKTDTGHQSCILTISKERVRIELCEIFDAIPFSKNTRMVTVDDNVLSAATWMVDNPNFDSFFDKVQTMIYDKVSSSNMSFDVDFLISEVLNCGVL